jgi:hypothetical protein
MAGDASAVRERSGSPRGNWRQGSLLQPAFRQTTTHSGLWGYVRLTESCYNSVASAAEKDCPTRHTLWQ